MIGFISQSNYIPWRGFIDLIRQSDIYIIYDSMQFTKNDWRNRNLIRLNEKEHWLSVPCGSSISRSIDEVRPTNANWYIKHAQTLKHSYAKAPYWKEFGEELLTVYQGLAGKTLSEINERLLRYILKVEGVTTKVIRDVSLMDKEYIFQLDKSERLAEICKLIGVSTYLSAPAGKNYLNQIPFTQKSIDVSFYEYPQYPSYTSFDRELSWIDTLMHRGSLFA